MDDPHSPFILAEDEPSDSFLDTLVLMPKEGIVFHHDDALITREPLIQDPLEERREMRRWIQATLRACGMVLDKTDTPKPPLVGMDLVLVDDEEHGDKASRSEPTLHLSMITAGRVPGNGLEFLSDLACMKPPPVYERDNNPMGESSRSVALVRGRVPSKSNHTSASPSKRSRSDSDSGSESESQVSLDSDEELEREEHSRSSLGKRAKGRKSTQEAVRITPYDSADQIVRGSVYAEQVDDIIQKMTSKKTETREQGNDPKLYQQCVRELYGKGKKVVKGSREYHRVRALMYERSKHKTVEVKVNRFDSKERKRMIAHYHPKDRRVIEQRKRWLHEEEVKERAQKQVQKWQEGEDPRIIRKSDIDRFLHLVLEHMESHGFQLGGRVSFSSSFKQAMRDWVENLLQNVLRDERIVMGNSGQLTPHHVWTYEQLCAHQSMSGIPIQLTQDQMDHSQLQNARSAKAVEQVKQKLEQIHYPREKKPRSIKSV